MRKKAARDAAILKRRAAREVALMRCFSEALGGRVDYTLIAEQAELCVDEKKINFNFSDMLSDGAIQRAQELDARIEEASTSWKLERISIIDLCIIRIALFEMLYCEEIPTEVSINEAVELAKKYGGEKSAPYVNGVLGALARSIFPGSEVAAKISVEAVGLAGEEYQASETTEDSETTEFAEATAEYTDEHNEKDISDDIIIVDSEAEFGAEQENEGQHIKTQNSGDQPEEIREETVGADKEI